MRLQPMLAVLLLQPVWKEQKHLSAVVLTRLLKHGQQLMLVIIQPLLNKLLLILRDVTAPVITIAAATPITICNPTACTVAAAFGNATATDACGTVTPTGVEGTETLVSGCTYQVIKTWTATDACNNSATAQQTVTYTKDVTAPVITIAAATPITIVIQLRHRYAAALVMRLQPMLAVLLLQPVSKEQKHLSAVVLTRLLKHGQQLMHVIIHPLLSKLLLILKM